MSIFIFSIDKLPKSYFGNCLGDFAILGPTRRARDDRRVRHKKMREFKTGLNVRRFLNKKKKTCV